MRSAVLLAALAVVAVALLAARRRQPVPASWELVEPLLNTNGSLPSPDPYVLVLYQRRGMATGGNSDRAVWA